MVGTPAPGWYADPGDVSRHRYWDGKRWTTKTRSAVTGFAEERSTGPRFLVWMWIGLAVLMVGGIGAAVALTLTSNDDALNASDDPTPTEEAQPVPTTEPSEVVIPEGWSLYTSETGVVSYAIDPSWVDALTPGDQEFIHSWWADFPEVRSEYSGAWLLEQESILDNVSITVVSYDDGERPTFLQMWARSYGDTESMEDVEILFDEEYANDRGYDGWRFEYSGDYQGVDYSESVIVLRAGTTLVYIYGVSDVGFEPLTEGLLALADSLVVHHPPTGH
jgi:hypothetical protein